MTLDRASDTRSRRVVALTWCALIASSVALLGGCDWPGKPNPADRPVPPENVLEFGALFKRNCAGCHGAKGELGPAPPLRDGLFRASVPEGELERVVTVGRPGTPMPGFALANGGVLTPTQIQVLVYEIKGLPYKLVKEGAQDESRLKPVPDAEGIAPQWGLPKPLPANAPAYLRSGPKSVRTSADYETIRKGVYARACAGCHGERGEGGPEAGSINDPSFLALISDQALRRLILTGRPDLGMPDYADTTGRDPDFKSLTSAEIADLVDLLASWRTGRAAAGESQVRTDN